MNGVDPSGRIVVVMSGWNRPKADMVKIRERIISKLRPRLNKYDRRIVGNGMIGWVAVGGRRLEDDGVYDQQPAKTQSYDDFVRMHFDAFVARKKADPCRLEQFIAVGHSSGASAILNQIIAHNFGGPYPPAFLGMIDPVLAKHGRDITMDNGPYTHEVVYYQRRSFLKGSRIEGADNFRIRNTTHSSIMKDERVIEGIAEKAARAYELRVRMDIQSGPPGTLLWGTRSGRVRDGKLEGDFW